MVVEWNKLALDQLGKALIFIIDTGSITYAFEVEARISSKVDELAQHSYAHPPDKYKRNNKGNHRAFEVDDYRISYRIKRDVITILQIRHTSRKPRFY